MSSYASVTTGQVDTIVVPGSPKRVNEQMVENKLDLVALYERVFGVHLRKGDFTRALKNLDARDCAFFPKLFHAIRVYNRTLDRDDQDYTGRRLTKLITMGFGGQVFHTSKRSQIGMISFGRSWDNPTGASINYPQLATHDRVIFHFGEAMGQIIRRDWTNSGVVCEARPGNSMVIPNGSTPVSLYYHSAYDGKHEWRITSGRYVNRNGDINGAAKIDALKADQYTAGSLPPNLTWEEVSAAILGSVDTGILSTSMTYQFFVLSRECRVTIDHHHVVFAGALHNGTGVYCDCVQMPIAMTHLANLPWGGMPGLNEAEQAYISNGQIVIGRDYRELNDLMKKPLNTQRNSALIAAWNISPFAMQILRIYIEGKADSLSNHWKRFFTNEKMAELLSVYAVDDATMGIYDIDPVAVVNEMVAYFKVSSIEQPDDFLYAGVAIDGTADPIEAKADADE